MDAKTVYSQKADRYAHYRWDYAPGAVEAIFNVSALGRSAVAADIGAGTGKFTRNLAGRVAHAYAVEPNPEMRRVAAVELTGCQECELVDGSAEATTLPDHSVDLITVAQAIHWFNPEPTRAEFRRILKPGGWLAVLSNSNANVMLNPALAELSSPEYGFDPHIIQQRPVWKPLIYFYGNGRFKTARFEFSFEEDWERFFGSLLSTAGMPDEDHPLFPRLEEAARQVFEHFSVNGIMEVQGVTELFIGQVSGIA